MSWLGETLNSAGLIRLRPFSAGVILSVSGLLIAGLVFEATNILALACSVSIGAIGLLLEGLNARANSRRSALASVWPEVLDFIISAISSGSSVTESIADLAEDGPLALREHFLSFKQSLDGGKQVPLAFQQLKVRLGSTYSDRLIEVLSLVEEAGGTGLMESLRLQVKLAREDIAFRGELTSRLGWITGTAKIAVGAPWLVVVMLATRPENVSAYSSTEGSLILMFGLFLSIFAFRLVKTFGLLPVSPRVFA